MAECNDSDSGDDNNGHLYETYLQKINQCKDGNEFKELFINYHKEKRKRKAKPNNEVSQCFESRLKSSPVINDNYKSKLRARKLEVSEDHDAENGFHSNDGPFSVKHSIRDKSDDTIIIEPIDDDFAESDAEEEKSPIKLPLPNVAVSKFASSKIIISPESSETTPLKDVPSSVKRKSDEIHSSTVSVPKIKILKNGNSLINPKPFVLNDEPSVSDNPPVESETSDKNDNSKSEKSHVNSVQLSHELSKSEKPPVKSSSERMNDDSNAASKSQSSLNVRSKIVNSHPEDVSSPVPSSSSSNMNIEHETPNNKESAIDSMELSHKSMKSQKSPVESSEQKPKNDKPNDEPKAALNLRSKNAHPEDVSSPVNIETELSDDDDDDSLDSDDSDYKTKQTNRKRNDGIIKYEKLMNDPKLKLKSFVSLLKVDNDLIEESYCNATRVFEKITERESKFNNSLPSLGLTRINLRVKKKRIYKSEAAKEIDRLCRIPNMNKRKRVPQNSTVTIASDADDSCDPKQKEKSSSSPKKTQKKIESSPPLSSDNDINDNDINDNDINDNDINDIDDDDIIVAKRVKNTQFNDTESLKSIDLAELSDDCDEKENDEKKKNAKEKRNVINKKKVEVSDDKNDDKNDDADDDENDEETENTRKKKKSKIDAVLERANQCLREGKEKTKIVKEKLNDDSDDEIRTKKKVMKKVTKGSKKRSSASSDYEESEESEESEDSEGSLSTDKDPSCSEDDSDAKRKRNMNSKRNQKKSGKSKGGKNRRRRVVRLSSGDDEESDDDKESPTKGRKKIHKIISDKNLKKQTRDATQAEKERRQRIEDQQKLYNEIVKLRTKSSTVKELILEFDRKTKEPLIEVDHSLVSELKPHQVEGIKFMYQSTIEKIANLKRSDGSGCILAHSMGLGKTLQVIAFLHTIMTNEYTSEYIKRALVICPVNTTRNWANEFRIWCYDNNLDVFVFEMSDAKTVNLRVDMLKQWKKKGGALIIGYNLLATMIEGGRGRKLKKNVRDVYEECLVNPGPDIVVCDEGHLLKNAKTSYNKSVSKIRTQRRVVLTGTPLQNNLNEYYVMVNFVKPNLLGTNNEFKNRFVNPISNGQHFDSTDHDVKIMKKIVYTLHRLLEASVHRCDYNVLTPYLQPKFEYVISIKLSDVQIQLYKHYLDNISDRSMGRVNLLADYGVLRLIYNHPSLLYEQHERNQLKRDEEEDENSLRDFIDDDEEDSESSVSTPKSGDSDIECLDKPSTSKPQRRRTRFGKHDDDDDEEVINDWGANRDNRTPKDEKVPSPNTWFSQFISVEDRQRIELGSKFVILFSILEECEKMGDKVLLFSQSLDTLDLLEYYLKMKMEDSKNDSLKENEKSSTSLNEISNIWLKNVDYFRIDGSTANDYRKKWIDEFNEMSNYRARLFMLSTKAGSLGVNLFGANRCIIFDASWNPTHDIQAIFRIYRFGQTKPVYVYRFLAQGCMEEKIYERQIIKQSLACRVVDEQQIQRHFRASDLQELYAFTPDVRTERPTPILPKDRLLAELLIKQKDIIVNYHEHDSLLENRPEEELTEDERQLAWQEFEQQKEEAHLRELQQIEMERRRKEAWEMMRQQQEQQQQFQQQQQQFSQFPFQNMANAFAQQFLYQQPQQTQSQQPQPQQTHPQQPQPHGNMTAPTMAQGPSLPSYDKLTVENLYTFVRKSGTEPDMIDNRISLILNNGMNTCTAEYGNIQKQMLTGNASPELISRFGKVTQEIMNLQKQKKRFELHIRKKLMRQNAANDGTLIDDPNKKTVSQLIEEVD